MSNAELIQEYSSLPEPLRQEVDDFIAFLKQRAKNTGLNGHASLAAGTELYDLNAELDGPITGYEDYIMD